MAEITVPQAIVNLALKLQGTPYIWGGNNPITGFDCSGFCIWILQVFDRCETGDWSSDGLRRKYPKVEIPSLGDLCLYGKYGAAKHVMLYIGKINGVDHCIGASGGDSGVRDYNEAARRNAKVKIKPVSYRTDFLGYHATGQLFA